MLSVPSWPSLKFPWIYSLGNEILVQGKWLLFTRVTELLWGMRSLSLTRLIANSVATFATKIWRQFSYAWHHCQITCFSEVPEEVFSEKDVILESRWLTLFAGIWRFFAIWNSYSITWHYCHFCNDFVVLYIWMLLNHISIIFLTLLRNLHYFENNFTTLRILWLVCLLLFPFQVSGTYVHKLWCIMNYYRICDRIFIRVISRFHDVVIW